MFFKKSLGKKIFSFFLFSVFSVSLMAQAPQMQPQQAVPQDYTDEQLELFAHAVQEVMQIQEEGQMEMMQAIEDNDMSIDRFNELLTESQQAGPQGVEASEEELAAFNQSINQVQALQMQMNENMMQAIADAGLDVQMYQNIMQAYEQNPELKAKIDQIFMQMEQR